VTPTSRFDVVGVGANSVDYVYRLPAYPEPEGPNAKMRVTTHAVLCGGQVTTALATCAALGLRTKYVGAFGTDHNGRRIREELARRAIDTSDAVIRESPNPFAVILLAEDAGERIVLWDRDERLTLQRQELPADAITHARVLHVDDVDQPAAIAAARMARAAGVPVTSDIDRLTESTDELVASVTIPIFAEHVPPALTGQSDPERALRQIKREHHRLVCVTLGARGAMLLHGDRIYHEPAFQVHVVDTTGSGDVFRGAFISGLLQQKGPVELLRFANATAGLSCTRAGAMDGVPRAEEIAKLLNDGTLLDVTGTRRG
jgi:sugar/nucleoside kinase (ribokinase family)